MNCSKSAACRRNKAIATPFTGNDSDITSTCAELQRNDVMRKGIAADLSVRGQPAGVIRAEDYARRGKPASHDLCEFSPP